MARASDRDHKAPPACQGCVSIMSVDVSPATGAAPVDASALVASVLTSDGLDADDAAALAAALAAEFDVPVSATAAAFATPAPKDSSAGVVDSVASEATVAAEDDDDVPLWLREDAPKEERRRVPPLAWSAAPMLSPAAEEAGSSTSSSNNTSGRSSLGRRAGAGTTARAAIAAASPAPAAEPNPYEAALAALLLPADEAEDDDPRGSSGSGRTGGGTPSSSGSGGTGSRSRASPAAAAGRSAPRPQLVACRSLLGCTWHTGIVGATPAAIVTASASADASASAGCGDDSAPAGRWGHMAVLAPAPGGGAASSSSSPTGAAGTTDDGGVLIVAGGENAAGPCDDTWELDWGESVDAARHCGVAWCATASFSCHLCCRYRCARHCRATSVEAPHDWCSRAVSGSSHVGWCRVAARRTLCAGVRRRPRAHRLQWRRHGRLRRRHRRRCFARGC